MCTPCGGCVSRNAHWCQKNICIAYIRAYVLVLKTPVWCTSHSTQRMHMHLGKHARATVQPLLCHTNYCDTSYELSFAHKTVRIHASPWRSRSCQAVLLHRHHLIIHTGAELIELANGSPPTFATDEIRFNRLILRSDFLYRYFRDVDKLSWDLLIVLGPDWGRCAILVQSAHLWSS